MLLFSNSALGTEKFLFWNLVILENITDLIAVDTKEVQASYGTS